MKLVRMNWKRPVPLWILLIAMLVTASVTTGVILLPSVLSPKPDFTMSLSLHPMYLQASGSNQTIITIQPVGNLKGAVTVTTLSSTGLTTKTQDPQTGGAKDWVILGKGGNLSLVVTDRNVGNFTVNITASSGTIVHSASFPVIVENLTMTSIPSYLTIMRGSTGTAEIDLSSVNGLSDNVFLGSEVLLIPFMRIVSTNSNSSLTPTNILVSPGGTEKVVLKISVGKGETAGFLTVIVAAHTVREPWTFYLYSGFYVV
jgi:hypothetical protein